MTKEYIGDSVYVEFDGYGLVLTTDNGFGPTNTITLEPEVFHALARFTHWRRTTDAAAPRGPFRDY